MRGVYRSTEELERDRAEWFERLPSSLGFHGSATELAKVQLDESDLRWGVLERWRHRGLRLVDPFWPGLERARALRQARAETRFGPFDGVVGPELVEEANVLGQDLSATSMADYATCPYRFFLRKVLGIRSLDEPEDTLEIAPKSKGTLVHRILERLVLRYLETSESWVGLPRAR